MGKVQTGGECEGEKQKYREGVRENKRERDGRRGQKGLAMGNVRTLISQSVYLSVS